MSSPASPSIPLLLVKLWSVYPNLFRWPPARSVKHAVERASVAVLVSTALVQVTIGLFNALNWYPWPWNFVLVHRFLAYVLIGSVLLHIAVKLPDIRYGLERQGRRRRRADRDPLEREPRRAQQRRARCRRRRPRHLTRRGLLTATGAGIGVVVVTTVGQTLTPLEPIGLLAIRQPSTGPQGVPVNRTAEQAQGDRPGAAADWTLQVDGPPAVRAEPGRGGGDGRARGALPDLLRRGVERRRALARPPPARRGAPAPAAAPTRGSASHSLEPRGSYNHSVSTDRSSAEPCSPPT